MLIIPMFLGKSPVLSAFGNGLRPIGWVALSLGLLLLGIHHLTKSRSSIPSLAEVLRELDEPVRTPRAAPQWSPAVFAAIEWRRFEAVCETLFAQSGFETKSQSHGADGGVDIWLYSRNAQGPVAVVQCKHWRSKPVGVKELREFYGVMASHKLTRGTYATTSTYTADAQRFATDNHINALDGNGLLALIAKRTPLEQQALLDVAFEGEYWRPTCANCGIKLVERTPSKGGAKFWGCSNYPRCKSRLPMATLMNG
jgi:restriction system protein